MGYLKEKYKEAYFLKVDENGIPTVYGVEGITDFHGNSIRVQDKQLLKRINFSDKVVLDIGFGRGEAIKYAKEHGAIDVIGVDFSQDAYDIAKAYLERNMIAASLYCDDALAFIKSNKLDLPPVDVVLMLDFVEHVPRSELTEVFKELHHCLTKKCVIVINTPVFKIDNDVISEGLKPEAMDTTDEFLETQGMHCNRYSKESLIQYMNGLGFFSLSCHFFVNNWPYGKKGSPQKYRWIRAFTMGYPVKIGTLFHEDQFEYALTSAEIETLCQKIEKNKSVRISIIQKMMEIKKIFAKNIRDNDDG